jgi:hypothetical protein
MYPYNNSTNNNLENFASSEMEQKRKSLNKTQQALLDYEQLELDLGLEKKDKNLEKRRSNVNNIIIPKKVRNNVNNIIKIGMKLSRGDIDALILDASDMDVDDIANRLILVGNLANLEPVSGGGKYNQALSAAKDHVKQGGSMPKIDLTGNAMIDATNKIKAAAAFIQNLRDIAAQEAAKHTDALQTDKQLKYQSAQQAALEAEERTAQQATALQEALQAAQQAAAQQTAAEQAAQLAQQQASQQSDALQAAQKVLKKAAQKAAGLEVKATKTKVKDDAADAAIQKAINSATIALKEAEAEAEAVIKKEQEIANNAILAQKKAKADALEQINTINKNIAAKKQRVENIEKETELQLSEVSTELTKIKEKEADIQGSTFSKYFYNTILPISVVIIILFLIWSLF